MAKERVTYLDMAKGVGILLVILGHEADLPLAARQFVTSFHMPLFFILSGMAVCLTGEKERPFSQILKRKSRSIMRPYFIFSVLCLIMEVFCAGVLKNVLWETVREHLWKRFWMCLRNWQNGSANRSWIFLRFPAGFRI